LLMRYNNVVRQSKYPKIPNKEISLIKKGELTTLDQRSIELSGFPKSMSARAS